MATKYKRAGAGNWNVDSSWSTTSGGAADTVAPTAADDVVVDVNSGNLTTAGTDVCRSLDFDGYTGTFAGSAAVTIGDGTAGAGNICLRLSSGMVVTFTGGFTIATTSGTQQTITCNGKTIGGGVTQSGVGGNIIFADNFSCSGSLSVTAGTFNDNGVTVTCSTFTSNSSSTRSLTLTGTYLYQATSATFLFQINNNTGLTFNGSGATHRIATSSSNTRTIQITPALSIGAIEYTVAGSSGILYFDWNNTSLSKTLSRLTVSDATGSKTVQFRAASTTIISSASGWQVSGGSGRLVTITSSTAAIHNLSVTSGAVSSSYVNLSYSSAAGGATFTATNSTDGGNNSGWTFPSSGNNSGLTTGLRSSPRLTDLNSANNSVV